ncbi:MAG: hypothetical protein AAF479_08625 [Pseudomonadota bacterium]
MFQDDRMISILSAVVLMVAIGTVIQRADIFQAGPDDEAVLILNPDTVDARANRLLRIDVLNNDSGLERADYANLELLSEPACGRVFVQGNALQYLPDASCVGQQRFQYGIDGRSGAVGEVVARMFTAEGKPTKAKADAAPVAKAKDKTPEQTPTNRVVVAAAEATETEAQPSSPAEGASKDEPDLVAEARQDEPSASVVDTLMQGAAQTAQAAATPQPSVAAARASDLLRNNRTVAPALPEPEDEPAKVEPEQPRPQIAALTTPRTDVASVSEEARDTASAVSRETSASEPANSPQPDPVRLLKPKAALLTQSPVPGTPEDQVIAKASDRMDVAGLGDTERSPVRPLPQSTTGHTLDDSGFLVAVVERKEPNTSAPNSPFALTADSLLQGVDTRAGSGSTDVVDPRMALADPLGSVEEADTGLVPALRSSPVDTNQLPPDPNAVLQSTIPPLKPVVTPTGDVTGALDQTGAASGRPDPSLRNAPLAPATPSGTELAALPRHDAPCVIPPAMTIDVRRAARSIVSVNAPCHANTVAELRYSGIHLAVPLSDQGRGSLEVLGFEPNAPALLTFVNGEKIDFDLPFKGIDRVSRVAVVWDTPIHLELNAVEFDGEINGPDHVRPSQPREFEDVRRTGGGFLTSYRGYAGIGQNAQIYTFWHRRGGRSGVVELLIDFSHLVLSSL